MQNTIHISLQSKGGIGKSLIAVATAAWLRKKAGDVVVLNVDPENDTICQYASLGATDVDILTCGSSGEIDIDKIKFDAMIDKLASESRPVVIDVGTSAFRPFIAYLQEYGILQILADVGKTVYLDVMIAGGQHVPDTTAGAMEIKNIAAGTGAEIVIWNNKHKGDTGVLNADEGFIAAPDGVDFASVIGSTKSITMSQHSPQSQQRLDEIVFSPRALLDDVNANPDRGVVQKIVAAKYYNEIFDELDAAFA